MDFEEAVIYDKRTYLKMYWSSLVDAQIILTTFFTKSNLNLFIVKFSFFIFFWFQLVPNGSKNKFIDSSS